SPAVPGNSTCYSTPDKRPIEIGRPVVRALRRRSEEDVPVQTGRRRLIVGVPDRRTPLEAQPLCIVNLPDRAVPQQLDGAPLVPDAAALHPDLHHAIVFCGPPSPSAGLRIRCSWRIVWTTQKISLICPDMLRMPLSVKSRFRKRDGRVVIKFLPGTAVNCG